MDAITANTANTIFASTDLVRLIMFFLDPDSSAVFGRCNQKTLRCFFSDNFENDVIAVTQEKVWSTKWVNMVINCANIFSSNFRFGPSVDNMRFFIELMVTDNKCGIYFFTYFTVLAMSSASMRDVTLMCREKYYYCIRDHMVIFMDNWINTCDISVCCAFLHLAYIFGTEKDVRCIYHALMNRRQNGNHGIYENHCHLDVTSPAFIGTHNLDTGNDTLWNCDIGNDAHDFGNIKKKLLKKSLYDEIVDLENARSFNPGRHPLDPLRKN